MEAIPSASEAMPRASQTQSFKILYIHCTPSLQLFDVIFEDGESRKGIPHNGCSGIVGYCEVYGVRGNFCITLFPSTKMYAKIRSEKSNITMNITMNNMGHIMRKPDFCLCENKGTTQIIQSLFFLNTKFPASSHLLCLYSSVCIRPGPKP